MTKVLSFESKNGSVVVSQVNGKYIVAVKNLNILVESFDAASQYFDDFVTLTNDTETKEENDIYGV